MSTLERLNEQLAQLESWTETLERLEEIEDDLFWAWDQTQLLIREIEEDTDLEAWAQRLTPQERDATDLPASYAYTHLVLLPFVRTYLDKLPDEELDLDEERLEDEHPSALLWLATGLGISSNPTLEGQRLLGWYVEEDEEYGDEDEDENEYDDEDEDDEDEDDEIYEDDEDDSEQAITLSVEGFYTRLNALCALSPALRLRSLSISAHDFREDMVQRLDGLSALMLPELKSLRLELIRGNTTHLRELLEWSAAQPELETIQLQLHDLSSEHTLIDKAASPKHFMLLYESHADQRPLSTLFDSPLLAAVEDIQIVEQLTWQPEQERRPAQAHDELLPALAPHLPSTLEELFLSYNQSQQIDLNALATLQAPPRLKRLTFNLASFTPGSFEALLSSPVVSDLESLTLTSNKLRDEDAELIATTAPQALTHLSLDRNLLTQEGVVALATSPRLQGLTHFSMYGEVIHVQGVNELYTQFRDRGHRSAEERFGELRSLLQQPPDEERWEELCAILDIWPDMEQLEQEVIPYVLSYTEAWPIERCVMPERWLWRAKEGLPAPMLQLVTTIERNWVEDQDVSMAHTVGNHPQLRRLRSLVLDHTNMDQETLNALALSPNLQQLQALSLADYDWENPQAPQRVFLSATLPSLTQLSIKGFGLEEVFAQLLQAPYIAQLSSLALAEVELEREQLKALIKTGMSKQLERLTLQQCELDDAGLKLIYTTSAPKLWHLDLNVNAISSKGLTALLRSSLGQQLRVLELAYNPLDEGNAFNKLTDAPLQLERLNLSCTGVLDRTLKTLAQCAWLKHLKVLDLSGNDLSESKGLTALISSPHLGALEQLILKGNDLSQEQYELIHHTMTLPQAVRDQFHPDKWDDDDYMEDIFE